MKLRQSSGHALLAEFGRTREDYLNRVADIQYRAEERSVVISNRLAELEDEAEVLASLPLEAA